MITITGGVTAAKGFSAGAVHCGIRKNLTKKDLMAIYSEKICTAAAVYTQNKVFGAPITVTKENLIDGKAQLMICNSGNANTCNKDGVEIAEKMCIKAGEKFKISAKDIIVASTGVIGQPLDITKIEKGISEITLKEDGSEEASEGILTTDLVEKTTAVEFELSGKKCIIGTIAKGSGMINPNMATMLGFITTDVSISAQMLKEALTDSISGTYNMICVDGDTSTNDMVAIMANGMAENTEITEKNEDYNIFVKMLTEVNKCMSKKIARDGEGATKLITAKVHSAHCEMEARKIAKSVITSSLVKTAMFGADANWGRILCAMGYSGADFDPLKVDVSFQNNKGTLTVCEGGYGIEFSEEFAKELLSEDSIDIVINLNSGEHTAEAYGCDLTYDYVKINGDYRT